MPPIRISVVVPTYNPRPDYLRRVLDALAAQTLPITEFEVLVIDNASKEPPAIQGPTKIRALREPRPGLRYARECGILASQADVIVFVDDDNVLSLDYLELGLKYLAGNPEIGAIGGRILPEFEVAAQNWVTPHYDLLALRDFGPNPAKSEWNRSGRKQYPWCAPVGAGMIIRKHCAQAYLSAIESMPDAATDRQGGNLGAAGDNEMILCGVLQQGLEVAYVPELNLTHLIAARRLTYVHMNRLVYQTTETWCRFNVRHGMMSPISGWSVPIRSLRSFFVQRAWTKNGYLRWRRSCGEFSGRAYRRVARPAVTS